MKTVFSILLVLLFLFADFEAEALTIEEFRNTTNSDERRKAITDAPPEMKEELEKLHIHLSLLSTYGGEEQLKFARESFVARARGLEYFEALFGLQLQFRDGFNSSILIAEQDAGMPGEKLAVLDKEMAAGRKALWARAHFQVHALVFNMAPTKEALKLAKKVEILFRELEAKFITAGQLITKEQLAKLDAQMDQIFEEMKRLPALPPEQVKKEYDAFPEKEIRP